MYFEIVGTITDVEVIARGTSIRELKGLKEQFGGKNWKKMKGVATVRLSDQSERRAEVHWYEAHGVGRRKLKIKHLLD
jgi:hypothetical protein